MVPAYTFFDIDGTLSAPCYINDRGEPVIGFTIEGWDAFTQERGEHSYDACRPVPFVKAFAEKLKQEGAVLYILTASRYPGETRAKHVFIDKHYPGLFDELITVSSDAEKLTVIQDFAAQKNIALSDCMLVEDTLETLFRAQVLGITSVHVSNIAAGNIADKPSRM